ncbi:MAG: CBS domain-containing protein, partial [Candidatus Bathyarchaeia archaeon]
EKNAYEVFIEETTKVGMTTVRDILGASNLTAKTSSVLNYVPKLHPSTSIGEAARILMQYRIRALPIVEKEKVTGAVTALSILKAFKGSVPPNVKAKDIMTSNPITIGKFDRATKARNVMVRRKIDHLPILDGQQARGLVTSTQMIQCMAPAEQTERRLIGVTDSKRLDFTLNDFMDSNLLLGETSETVSSILEKMLTYNSTYALLQLWDEIQGIITYRDIMKLLAQPQEAGDLPLYIIGLPEDPFEAEIARTKFTRTVNSLKKAFPFIEEARATLRKSSPTQHKERQRFEVNVAIRTPKQIFNFSQTGWELSGIFDILGTRAKRLMRKKQRRRDSIRYVENE